MASNRYLAAALTAAAAVAGSVGGAVYQSSTQSEARTAIGAGTSSVTLPGTGVVVVHSGDAGTLDAAGAPDGAVATLVGGAPQWAAASGGSLPSGTGFVTVSSGTGGVLTATSTSAAGLLAALGPTVPTAGALHHWRLSGSGPWSDLGSGAATLSATGSWETDQVGVSIYRGGVAITSPSSGDRLTATVNIASGSNLTIAVTVGARYDNSWSWGGVRCVMMAWNGSTATRNLLFIGTSAGGVYVSSGVAGSSNQTATIGGINWSIPHRLVATHQQSNGAVKFYIDGVVVGSTTDTGTRPALTEVTIGGITGNGFGVSPALVAMGDAMLSTDVWTSAQVVTDYLNARAAMGR